MERWEWLASGCAVPPPNSVKPDPEIVCVMFPRDESYQEEFEDFHRLILDQTSF
jgi:hypothetical protein